MADIILERLAPGAPGTFGPGGLYGSTADPRRGAPPGSTGFLGAFQPLLQAVVPVLSWLAPLAGAAAAIFPGAAPLIQQVAGAIGTLFNPAQPAGPVAPPSVAAGTVPGIGVTYGTSNPVAVPFDETSLLTQAFPQSVSMAGVGTGMMTIAGSLVARALPAIEAVVPKLLTRLPQAAALASAIYATYQGLRAQGQSHKTAKRTALHAHGVFLKRRRMRVTNVRALRRAGRRVHGFQKLARKLGALHVAGRGSRVFAGHPRRRYRVHRRGDLSPFIVEDFEDMTDQLEDEGYSPDTFLDDAAVGE